ncbi:MAG TPA: hypothetical protein VGD74_12045 [Vulgatibacter sp.]
MDPGAWLETARDRYLQLRGSGLVLSPLDADRLRGWRDRGLPLDLVLHGLELAHASWIGAGRANASRPFPLWAAERHVEELARGWERRAPSSDPVEAAQPPAGGDADEAHPTESKSPSAIENSITKLERLLGGGPSAAGPRGDADGRSEGAGAARWEPATSAYRAALAALWWADRVGAEESRALLLADEAAGIAFVIALPRPERRNVVSEVMRRAGPRGAATRARHRAMLRALLAEAAFRHGGLERPSDP